MKQCKTFFLTSVIFTLVLSGCENPATGGDGSLVYPEGAVEDIINLPYRAYANVGKTLSGTIIPEDPAKTIVWELTDAGTTGATIEDGAFTATAAGTAWIRATVANGIKSGMDYTKDFSIDVLDPPDYGIDVSINHIEINNEYSGYAFGTTDPVTVRIQNIGRNATGALTVTLSGDNSSSFEVSTESINSIPLEEEASFTVNPKSELSSGTYSATVTISGDNITQSLSFSVSFTVPGYAAGAQVSREISSIDINFRYVPASVNSFVLDEEETPATITKGYWIMETEVTQELWAAVFLDDNPSYFDGTEDEEDEPSKATPEAETQNQRPVDGVSWYAAIAFCNKLSLANDKTPVYQIGGIDDWSEIDFDDIPNEDEPDETWDAVTIDEEANGYRLPTVNEWVWAAMGATLGGTDVFTVGWQKGYAGSNEEWDDGYPGVDNIGNYAWYYDNSDEVTHEVGQKTANELGIYDMSGNVYEWCWDWDEEMGEEEYRITLGGSCYFSDSDCALTERYSWEPYEIGDDDKSIGIGFRIVCNEDTDE